MKTTSTSVSAVLLALSLCVSIAAGGAPIGPPIAVLEEGQWSLGGEFAHEQIDLQGSGRFQAVYLTDHTYDLVETQQIEDLTMDMFFGTLAYGVCDNWDVFVRLGASGAKDGMSGTSDVSESGVLEDYSLGAFDGSYGFAWGIGTRATFARRGPWSFGGLAQVTWFQPGESDIVYVDPIVPSQDPSVTHVGTANLDFWQTQVSLAAAYERDALRVWGGPLLQFVKGDMDRSGSILYGTLDPGDTFDASGDIQEKSRFGGHVGASWDATEQWNLWIEGQITGDSWLIGVGATFVPETSGK